MNIPLLVLGGLLTAVPGALMLLKMIGRGWLIPTGFGLLMVLSATNPPQWLAVTAGAVFWILTLVGLYKLVVGNIDESRRKFRTTVKTMNVLLLVAAIAGFGFALASGSPSVSANAPARVNVAAPAIPDGAGAHATVTLATATASCRADAVDSYLQGQGFKAASYTVGTGKVNHTFAELTATGSAHFGAASTTRKGLQKYLDSGSAPAKANRAMLREKYPSVPAQTLFDADNWEVFQSKVPMSIHGNHGWEDGQSINLGTRSSAAGDAVWLYVDPVSCKVPAANPKFELASSVTRLDNQPSVRPVGVIRVGCSNPGNNVTPGHHSMPVPQKPKPHKPTPKHHKPTPKPSKTPTPTPSVTKTPGPTPTPSDTPSETPTPTPTPDTTPTPTPTPSQTTTPPAVCEYNSQLPANSPDCVKPTPTPTPCAYDSHLPANSPDCKPQPTPTPTPTPTPCRYNPQLPADSKDCVKPTPTPTPTPSPTCEYGVNDEGHCKKSTNPDDYAQPGNGGKGQDVGEGTKPPVKADPTPEATPKPVKTEQPGGGGVVDTPTKPVGSETGGNAPGAAPAPSSPRPVPSDEGGAPAKNTGSGSSNSDPAPVHTSEPSPEPSHSEPAPQPVHTDPVDQPSW